MLTVCTLGHLFHEAVGNFRFLTVKLSRVNDHRAGHWCADTFGRSAMNYPLSTLRITVLQPLIFDRASPSKTTLNWFFTLRYYEIPKTNFLLLKEEENEFFWFAEIIRRKVRNTTDWSASPSSPLLNLFAPPTALSSSRHSRAGSYSSNISAGIAMV